MKKDLKVPKNKKENVLSNDVEATLIGVLILLVSLIGLLGKGPVGEFLQYCIVFIFGNFYFLVYAYLIFLSLYLIITKKFYMMKFNLYTTSFILIVFSFLIGSSSSNVELTMSNFTSVYLNVLERTPGIELFSISSLDAISYTGGGYLGYMLTGFLNTCFTNVGTSITIAVFAVVGISIFLKDFIVYFIKFINSLRKKFLDRKDKKMENKQIQIDLEDNTIKEVKSEKIDSPIKQTEIKFDDEQKETVSKTIVQKVEDEIERIKNPKMELFAQDIEDNSNYQSQTFAINHNINDEKKYDDNQNNKIFQSSNTVDPFVDNKKENDIEKIEDNYNRINNYVNDLDQLHEEKAKPYADYILPPLSLLKSYQNDDVSYENKLVAENRLNKINELFSQFKIGASAISYTIGPSCTRFNIKMNPGVKVNVLSSIQNEIAINLGGNKTVRLELVVEGRDTSSIEIGNAKIASVSYKECLQKISDRLSQKDKLLIPLGKGIEGNVVTVSIDELPHLLVAGTTGSGKSVFVNTLITTLIMRNRPDELKLMLIDPKKVEFSKYNELPHLICPVITEAIEGKNALKKLVEEMERRYSLFLTKGKGCSKLSEYNELAESLNYDKLPNIVMICDEFSDFMSDYGKEIEPLIKRLAQKARACGIYLIICTQRPSVNIITGDIKAVIPSRIALLVPQVIDSRIILDEGGAESLLGNGDMLCRIPHHNSLVRVQGAFIKNADIIQICDYIKSQANVEYDDNFTNLMETSDLGVVGDFNSSNRREKDALHEIAKQHVIESRIASTSNLQSRFGIGYGRADHILNCLEDEGVIKRSGNGNRRVVVMTMEEYQDSLKKNQENKINFDEE